MDKQGKKTPAAAPEISLPAPRKKKRWRTALIAVLVVLALVLILAVRGVMSAREKLSSSLYTLGTADYRDITVSVSGTAAVEPAEAYRLTALVRGEILEAPFEEGDQVEQGDLLYRIDAGDVEIAVERAEIAVEQARLSYESLLSSGAPDSQVENARLSLRSAELSLESAQEQLSAYTLTSPISGTVIEKNYKTGDNLDATTAGYLAVIYDMSSLTFEMRVDELYINEIQVGQEVRITADALPGETFTGHVSRVNINGTAMNGVTTYPVTVDIDQAQGLLPGMNVSAEILVEHAEDVLTVPVEMVQRGDVVQVLPPDAYDRSGNPDYSRLEERQVTLGRNDEDYIEILSGLEAGETVVYEAQATTLMEQLMSGGFAGGMALGAAGETP